MSDDQPKGEGFAALFEQGAGKTPKRVAIHVGARVEAPVVKITKDAVFVELDAKRQAWIEAMELLGPDGKISVKLGDVIAANVLEIDNRSGTIKLGRSLGKVADMASLEMAREQRIPVEGKVLSVNKGGVEVDVHSAKAFCPLSQLDIRQVADPAEFIGKTLQFRVTEVREGGRKVVLSRRAWLEAEAREKSEQLLRALSVGTTIKGSVSGVREFGAFVDLGGIEGLIPASELSYEHGVKVAEMVALGDIVEVQVKDLRPQADGSTRITLSLKALAADPWEALAVIAPVGRVIAGAVTRVVDFGAFVRVASGVEGLLHASELGPRGDHPSKHVQPGQALLVVVKSSDAATKKIALALAPDGVGAGGAVSSANIVVGSVVAVVVEKIEQYGAFVQIAGAKGRAGRGLIPNAELGLPRGADVRKQLPEGTSLRAKVLETGEGRLRLSVKAVGVDEERAAFEGYARTGGSGRSGMGTLGDLLERKRR